MAKAKIKDDLALLMVGLLVSIIAWGVFQLVGMWAFYIYFVLVVLVWAQRYQRKRKAHKIEAKDRDG
ncbi:hypothetical protein FE845_02015 [Marinobacter sp. 1-4A]|uniref:hypothetical protein n=1 Tax=Marinobacter sp. 1-4A TaxID=2582919 RepID=UPI001907F625|nr:hypothetical protein [Marinobacter sp. 1-4A]MBK1850099.1 hypothetical protein [Marinobacter sp. 1-4A]